MSGPTAGDPRTDAARAAAAAGVEVRLLTEMHETRQAEALMMRVWDSDRASVPLAAAPMRALAYSGNPVTGAFRRDEPDVLVGCTAGFSAPPAARSLHSHVAAVDTALAGRGVGAAMKLHQRAWALEHDVHWMTWTFDPLIARNAFFNLAKLGAAAASYLEDFYGLMADGLNAGSPAGTCGHRSRRAGRRAPPPARSP
jgi:predicted GNAT superfamily acetyltransferase